MSKKILNRLQAVVNLAERLYQKESSNPGSFSEEIIMLILSNVSYMRGRQRLLDIAAACYNNLDEASKISLVSSYINANEISDRANESDFIAPEPLETIIFLTPASLSENRIISSYSAKITNIIDNVANKVAELTPRRVNIYMQKEMEAFRHASDTREDIPLEEYPYMASEVIGGRASSLTEAQNFIADTAAQWKALDSVLEAVQVFWRELISTGAININNINILYSIMINHIYNVQSNLESGKTPENIISDLQTDIETAANNIT